MAPGCACPRPSAGVLCSPLRLEGLPPPQPAADDDAGRRGVHPPLPAARAAAGGFSASAITAGWPTLLAAMRSRWCSACWPLPPRPRRQGGAPQRRAVVRGPQRPLGLVVSALRHRCHDRNRAAAAASVSTPGLLMSCRRRIHLIASTSADGRVPVPTGRLVARGIDDVHNGPAAHRHRPRRPAPQGSSSPPAQVRHHGSQKAAKSSESAQAKAESALRLRFISK